MGPTVLRQGEFRFFFFSREESRCHVHVICPDGEAKYWLEPKVELAQNQGLNERKLRTVQRVIEENYDAIRAAWRRHFGS